MAISKRDKPEYESYQHKYIDIKSGWDLPEGETPPISGRKRESIRAYELLELRTEEDYIEQAEITRKVREENRRIKEENRRIIEEKRKQGQVPEVTLPEPVSYEEILQQDTVAGSAIRSSGERTDGIRTVSNQEWKRRRRKRICIILLVLIVLLGAADLMLAFGPPILTADISRYEDVEIEVEGVSDEVFTITPGDLAKLPLTRVSVPVHQGELAEGEAPELGKAIGPTLEEFLKQYGKTPEDFRSMKVYNERETSTAFVKTMKEETIVLSVANGRKPLGEKEAPLRIAIDGKDPGEWSGWIRKIVFTPY